MTESTPLPSILDQSIEDEIRNVLLEHFSPSYQDRVTNYVDALMGMAGFANRFEYLRSVVGSEVFSPASKILISGCGSARR
jgi:hypothetical protein